MNDEKMVPRHRVCDRDEFDYEYKQRVLAKSDDRCCLCGRKCYIGYGATIDHFFPLNKGGTNEFDNLVMLCDKCNQEKGQFVLSPQMVKRYLKPEYFESLKKYFIDYCQSFEYIDPTNLLFFDRYAYKHVPLTKRQMQKMKKDKSDIPGTTYILQKATKQNDLEELTDYFIKYFKKYSDMKLTEEQVCAIVKLWLKFSSVYYVKVNGEILVAFVLSIRTFESDLPLDVPIKTFRMSVGPIIPKVFSLGVFSYYQSDRAKTVANGIWSGIIDCICLDENIDSLPVTLYSASKDCTVGSDMQVGYEYDGECPLFHEINGVFGDVSPINIGGTNYFEPSVKYLSLCDRVRINPEEVYSWIRNNYDEETMMILLQCNRFAVEDD